MRLRPWTLLAKVSITAILSNVFLIGFMLLHFSHVINKIWWKQNETNTKDVEGIFLNRLYFGKLTTHLEVRRTIFPHEKKKNLITTFNFKTFSLLLFSLSFLLFVDTKLILGYFIVSTIHKSTRNASSIKWAAQEHIQYCTSRDADLQNWDSTTAETVMKALKPMKDATTIMSEESSPTIPDCAFASKTPWWNRGQDWRVILH